MFRTLLLTNGHTDSVNSLSLSDRLLASGGDDGNVYFWSLDESPNPVFHVPRTQPCSAVKFNPGDNNVLYSAHDRYIYSWDVRHLQSALSEWNVNEDEVNSIDVLESESRLAAADDSGAVQIIDTTNGSTVRILKKHDNICSAAKFRPGRTWQLISGGLDCRLIVSDWKGSGLGVIIFELTEIVPPPFFNGSQSAYNFHPSGYTNHGSSDSHASTSEYAEIDCSEQEDDDDATGEADESGQDFSYAPETRDNASIEQDNMNIDPSESSSETESEQSEPMASAVPSASDAWGSGLPVNPPMVHSIACSPSGDLVATGLERCTIELFEGTGKRLTHLKSLFGHHRAVSSLHFIGDTRLLSGGNDCNMFLWILDADSACRHIPHDAKINAIEGHQLDKIYLADCSPVIQLLDLTLC